MLLNLIHQINIRMKVFLLFLLPIFSAPAQNHYYMLFSSDPQYPWSETSMDEEKKKAKSRMEITSQYNSMTKLTRDMQGDPAKIEVKGVIVNGDLTAFGHDWQYDDYMDILKNHLLIPYNMGLGNHDYSNNVNDCYNNNCASRMVDYMYGQIKNNRYPNYDFTEESYYLFPQLRTDYRGSLSYSFNIGKVHFVELQNYPAYTNSWDSWNAGKAKRDFYSITSSEQWLKNDLANARNNGNIIILNLHDCNLSNEVQKALKDYSVSAIFSGHIHQDCGYVGSINSVPHFRSGSSTYRDYLLTEFNTETNKMTVKKITNDTLGNYTIAGTVGTYNLNSTVPNPPLPVPPKECFVTFINKGGFVAQFELAYTKANKERVSFSTGDMALHNRKTYYIPGDATEVKVFGKECTGLAWEWWKTVFDITLPNPPNKCYKVYGTTLHPGWNNDCE